MVSQAVNTTEENLHGDGRAGKAKAREAGERVSAETTKCAVTDRSTERKHRCLSGRLVEADAPGGPAPAREAYWGRKLFEPVEMQLSVPLSIGTKIGNRLPPFSTRSLGEGNISGRKVRSVLSFGSKLFLLLKSI